MASDLNDEDFRNELVELFALEAEEWLQQAKTAVQDLQREQGAQANPKLLEIIQQALSNLGGSAATVELPDIEKLAYGMLPTLEAIRSESDPASSGHLTSIQESLERLTENIRAISGEPAGAEESDAIDDIAAAMEPASPHISLDALRRVHEQLAQAGRASRNLLEVVIERGASRVTARPKDERELWGRPPDTTKG